MTTDTDPIRASHHERESTANALRDAAESGRLTASELDDRLARASSAQYRHELVALVSDLPAAPTLPMAKQLNTVRAAAAALFAAIVALVGRHKIIAAVVVVLVVAAVVAAIWLGAWDFGHGHGPGEGRGGGGDRPRMR